MRPFIFLFAVGLSLLGQTPRAIHLKIFETNEGLGSSLLQPKVVPSATLRPMVESALASRGHHLVSAKEVEEDPEGLLLYVHVVELEGKGDRVGWHVNVGCSRMSYVRQGKADPQGLGSEITWAGRPDRLKPEAWQAKLRADLVQILDRLEGKPAAAAAPAPRPPENQVIVDVDFVSVKVKYQPPVPPYPALARQYRAQGVVELEMVINPEGTPVEVACRKGDDLLRIMAMGYALDWRFEPPQRGGAPGWTRFLLKMPFRLQR